MLSVQDGGVGTDYWRCDESTSSVSLRYSVLRIDLQPRIVFVCDSHSLIQELDRSHTTFCEKATRWQTIRRFHRDGS